MARNHVNPDADQRQIHVQLEEIIRIRPDNVRIDIVSTDFSESRKIAEEQHRTSQRNYIGSWGCLVEQC